MLRVGDDETALVLNDESLGSVQSVVGGGEIDNEVDSVRRRLSLEHNAMCHRLTNRIQLGLTQTRARCTLAHHDYSSYKASNKNLLQTII